MISVWTHDSDLPHFEPLKGDIKTDVLIIGGGLAGVLCAYFLKQAGVNYVLVEGKTICSGITKNTTAKITSQHGLIYDKLINNAGIEKARMYLEANENAINKYRELCENFDCEFENKSAYVYTLKNPEVIEKEIRALEKLNFKAQFTNKIPLPFKINGAVKFENQAQFNPLKFVSSIVKGLNIYENTFVNEMIYPIH